MPADEGNTWLDPDLAELPDAPAAFIAQYDTTTRRAIAWPRLGRVAATAWLEMEQD